MISPNYFSISQSLVQAWFNRNDSVKGMQSEYKTLRAKQYGFWYMILPSKSNEKLCSLVVFDECGQYAYCVGDTTQIKDNFILLFSVKPEVDSKLHRADVSKGEGAESLYSNLPITSARAIASLLVAPDSFKYLDDNFMMRRLVARYVPPFKAMTNKQLGSPELKQLYNYCTSIISQQYFSSVGTVDTSRDELGYFIITPDDPNPAKNTGAVFAMNAEYFFVGADLSPWAHTYGFGQFANAITTDGGEKYHAFSAPKALVGCTPSAEDVSRAKKEAYEYMEKSIPVSPEHVFHLAEKLANIKLLDIDSKKVSIWYNKPGVLLVIPDSRENLVALMIVKESLKINNERILPLSTAEAYIIYNGVKIKKMNTNLHDEVCEFISAYKELKSL